MCDDRRVTVQPDVVDERHHLLHRQRHSLRRLHHHRISAGDRVRQEPERNHSWKIERADDGAHAERLPDHDLVDADRDVFGVVSLNQGRRAARHFDVLDRAAHLAPRLCERLAALLCNRSRNIVELRCTYDPATRGGDAPDGRKVKATLHWVSAPHALEAEVRLYDNLLTVAEPSEMDEDKDFTDYLNPNSLEVIERAFVEPTVQGASPQTRYQFERVGYFTVDPDSTSEKLVFNRTVTLKDEWVKIQKSAERS